MDTYEYWIGRNVRYTEYWNSYLSGGGYQTKFRSMETHAIEIQFENYSNDNPLFNFEVVYKTLKGYFHDLKRFCLSPEEYNHAGPLFIYEVNRGSGVWTLLGQLPYLLVYGTSLVNEKVIGQRLDNLHKKLEVLEKHFGDEVRPELYQSFMSAKTPSEIEFALSRLFDEKIKDVRISKKPFKGDIKESRNNMISLIEMIDKM